MATRYYYNIDDDGTGRPSTICEESGGPVLPTVGDEALIDGKRYRVKKVDPRPHPNPGPDTTDTVEVWLEEM